MIIYQVMFPQKYSPAFHGTFSGAQAAAKQNPVSDQEVHQYDIPSDKEAVIGMLNGTYKDWKLQRRWIRNKRGTLVDAPLDGAAEPAAAVAGDDRELADDVDRTTASDVGKALDAEEEGQERPPKRFASEVGVAGTPIEQIEVDPVKAREAAEWREAHPFRSYHAKK